MFAVSLVTNAPQREGNGRAAAVVIEVAALVLYRVLVISTSKMLRGGGGLAFDHHGDDKLADAREEGPQGGQTRRHEIAAGLDCQPGRDAGGVVCAVRETVHSNRDGETNARRNNATVGPFVSMDFRIIGCLFLFFTYKLPNKNTADRASFCFLETCRFQTTGIGRKSIMTSVVMFGALIPRQ